MDSETIRLCIEGTQAEFKGSPNLARDLYWQAWQAAADDYDACVAAHYMARFQADARSALEWNLVALARANALGEEHALAFYPSLYVNLGHSYEMLGDQSLAEKYYNLARGLGLTHKAE